MHTYLRRCYVTLGTTGAETSLLLTAYCIEQPSPYPRCRWALVVGWEQYKLVQVLNSNLISEWLC